MKNHMKYPALVTTILLSVAVASPATAEKREPEPTTQSIPITPASESQVVASEDAKVSFKKETVKAKPTKETPTPVIKPTPEPATIPAAVAPVEPTPEVAAPIATTPTPEPQPEPVVAAPAPQVTVQAALAPAPTAAPAPAPVASGVGAALVGSAYSQIGVAQDCTAMVEKALRSVGKSVGDLAPGQFFQYGSVVRSPAPGDLVITAGHVAIYVGNGQVISGGLNGLNTGIHPLSDLPGAAFVRVS